MQETLYQSYVLQLSIQARLLLQAGDHNMTMKMTFKHTKRLGTSQTLRPTNYLIRKTGVKAV